MNEWIEAPCSKLQGIFDRKECRHFWIRSLTPQLAAGNALAIAVQDPPASINRDGARTRLGSSFQNQDFGRWDAMFHQGLINGIPRVNRRDNNFVVVQ